MNYNQIKIGALLSYAALILGSAISLIYTPYMLRKLGQSEFGLFSLVNTTIAYLTVLDFGFGTAIIRYTAKYRTQHDKIKEQTLHGMFLLLYIGIGVFSFLVSMILVFNVERLFSTTMNTAELQTAKTLMWLAAFNLAMSFPFSVFPSIITAYEQFIFTKSVSLLRLIINPLCMVAVLTFGYNSVGMIVVTTGLNLLFNLIMFYYCKRNLHIKMLFSGFDLSLLKEVVTYSFFVFLNMIVDRLYWNTGQFLLGMFVGSVAVAIYAIGMQFVTMLYISISSATSSLFLPRITQISVNESTSELSDIFTRVGRIQFIMLALVLTGFLLYGYQFVNLWAGKEYATSYWVTIIIMIPLTIPLIQSMGISILQAKNMHAFRSIVFLVIALINVAVSIPLINIWGPIGCAIGTALSLTTGQIVIMNIYYRNHLKLEIGKFWREILKLLPAVLIPCVLAYLLRLWFPAEQIRSFTVNVLFYTTAYVVCMYLFGMNVYEKQLMIAPLKRLASKICL